MTDHTGVMLRDFNPEASRAHRHEPSARTMGEMRIAPRWILRKLRMTPYII